MLSSDPRGNVEWYRCTAISHCKILSSTSLYFSQHFGLRAASSSDRFGHSSGKASGTGGKSALMDDEEIAQMLQENERLKRAKAEKMCAQEHPDVEMLSRDQVNSRAERLRLDKREALRSAQSKSRPPSAPWMSSEGGTAHSVKKVFLLMLVVVCNCVQDLLVLLSVVM